MLLGSEKLIAGKLSNKFILVLVLGTSGKSIFSVADV